MFDLKKQKEETVSDAAMMVDPAGKKAVFFKDDQLFVTDIPKGKADLSKSSMRLGVLSGMVSIWRICMARIGRRSRRNTPPFFLT